MNLVIKSNKGYLCQTGQYKSDLYWTIDKNDSNIVFLRDGNDIKSFTRQIEFKEFVKVKYMIMPVELRDRFTEYADDKFVLGGRNEISEKK